MHRGIDVHAPVLVLTSGRSAYPEAWDDRVDGHDIVLDVDQIREWAHQLAPGQTRRPGATNLVPSDDSLHTTDPLRSP